MTVHDLALWIDRHHSVVQRRATEITLSFIDTANKGYVVRHGGFTQRRQFIIGKVDRVFQ